MYYDEHKFQKYSLQYIEPYLEETLYNLKCYLCCTLYIYVSEKNKRMYLTVVI